MTEAALYYEAARTGLGDLFLDDIQRAIDTVRERPRLGVAVSYGFRRALVRRFPFSLIYAVEGEEIVVVCGGASTTSPELLEGQNMTANNAFERTVGHRGPRLAAAQRWWPAAQLGR